jgi:hypothetical protein
MNKIIQNLAIFQKYKQYSKAVNRILYYWIKIYSFFYINLRKNMSLQLFSFTEQYFLLNKNEYLNKNEM